MRAILILAFLLAACSGSDKGYTVVMRNGPMVFVLLDPTTPHTEAAWAAIAREACGSAQLCNVKIWTDADKVARALPMTDREVNAIEAAYLVNRKTGADEFLCHPFGDPGKRCA